MNWFLVKNKTNSYTEALQMYKEARAPRDYKREYAQYHSKPQRVSERSQRNKARRKLGLSKGDPREVDHKNPISNGGSNARSNLRAVSLVKNRKKFTKTASEPHHTYVSQLTNLSSKKQKRLLAKEKKNEQKYGRKDFWKDPRYKAEMEMKHKKLFPSKTSWKQLNDRDFSKITKQYKKCRTDRDKHTAMMQELKKLGLPKDVWREKVRAPAGTWSKTASDRERTYGEMRDAIRGFAAKQNIDPEKAMLVAGGAGYMHGMRDEVNDLDFFHDDLPDFVQQPYGRFDMDGGPGKDLPDAAKQYQMMHGMRVQTPEAMLAFYQRLNRPKDQEKIKMLRAHLKTANNPRIPRKPGQPANSKKHSDLFTDENPKGTIHGLGFKTPAHAKKSVAKIKSSGKTHAHKTQAAIAMEQRARTMGKTEAANVYRAFIEEQKRITKQKRK